MDQPLERTAKEVLDRHPAPALSLTELSALLARERAGRTPEPDRLADTLRTRRGEIRILETDPARLAMVEPNGWAVAPPGAHRGGIPARSLAGRLRETLRTLGEVLEPGSNTALARWARMLNEERRVREILRRRRS